MIVLLVHGRYALLKEGEAAEPLANRISRCGYRGAGLLWKGRCKRRKCVTADLSLSFGHGRFRERGSLEAHRNWMAL